MIRCIGGRNRGFTLIELIIAVSIIALLVTVATYRYSSAQVTARDASRRSAVNTYKTALEQYFGVYHTYFVASNLNNCTLTNPAPDTRYSLESGGADCTGYYGSGQGGITRRLGTGNHYQNQSVADALQKLGYLKDAATDPQTRDYTTETLVTDASGNKIIKNDYTLRLCTLTAGETPSTTVDAQQYLLTAYFEHPDATDASMNSQVTTGCTAGLPGGNKQPYTVPAGSGTLAVTLASSPNSGTAPLTVQMTATVKPGSIAGPYTYNFYCNIGSTDPSLANQHTTVRSSSTTASAPCSYTNPASYTAKVQVLANNLSTWSDGLTIQANLNWIWIISRMPP